MLLLQIAYAVVILVGYVVHFVPELLQSRGSALPEANSLAGLRPPPAAGELGNQQPSERVSAPETASGAPSASPGGHSMRLRNRKGQHLTEAACSEDFSEDLRIKPVDFGGAASPLLDHRTLHLCGSFTLQVLHSTQSPPVRGGACARRCAPGVQ